MLRPAAVLRLWLFVAAWIVTRADTQRSLAVEAATTPAADPSAPVTPDASVDDPVPGFLDLFLPGLNSSESHAQDLGWHRARGSTSSTIRPCWLGDVFPGRIMQLELWAESHYATPVWLDPGELETLLLLRADNPFDVLSLLMHDELGSPTVSDPVAINDAAVRAYRKRNHMFTITLQHHQRLQPHQKRHIGVLTIRIPPPTARRVYAPNASPPPLTYLSALRYDWLLSMEARVNALNKALTGSQKETVHRDPVTRMPMVPLSVVPANILQVLFPYVSPLFVGALHLPKEDIAMLNQSVHLWQQFVNPRQSRPEQFIRPASSSVLFNQTLTLTPRNLHYSEHSAAAPLRLNPSRLHFFGNYVPRPHIVSGWFDESAIAGSARVSLTAPTLPPPAMSPGDSPHIVDFGMVELGNYRELALHFSHPFHFEVHELVQEGNVRRARPRSERNRDKLGDNIHAERDPSQSPIVLEALEVTLEYSHEELQPLPPFPLRSDPALLRDLHTKRPPSAGKPIKVLAKHNPFTFELLQTPEYKAVESSDLIKYARIIPFEKRNVSSSNAQRKATPPIPYTLYRLIFSPTAAGAFESVFVVRNNLTCVEMIVLRGWSARGSLTFRRTRFPILKEYNDAAMELIRQQELDPSRPLPPIGHQHFHPDPVAAAALTSSASAPDVAASDSKASAFPWRAYGQRFMDEAPGLEIGVVVGNKATAPPLEALYNDPSAHLLFHTSSSGASGLSPPSPYSDLALGVQSGSGGSNFPRLVLDLVEYCRFFYNIANEIELDHMIHLTADRQELLLNEDIKPSRFDRWEPDLLTRVVWENSASPVEPFGVQNDGPLGFYLVAVSVGPAVSLSQSRTRAHIPRRAPLVKSAPGAPQRGPNTQGSNAGTTGGGVRYGDPNVLLNGGKYALPLKHLNLCDRFNSIPSPHHFAFNGCSQLPIYFPPGHHQWFFLSYPMLAILVPEVMAQWVAAHPREHAHVLYLHLHTTTGIFSLPLELQLPAFLSSRLLLPWDEGTDLIARSTVNEKARAEAMIKVMAGGASNTAAPVSASSTHARPSIAAAAAAATTGSGFLRLLYHLLLIVVYAVACMLSLLLLNIVLKYRTAGGSRSLSSDLSRLSRSGLRTLQLWRKNVGQMLERRTAAAGAASGVSIDSAEEEEADDEIVQIAPVAAVAATTPASASASKSTPKKGKKTKNAHVNHATSSASASAAAAVVTSDAPAADELADAHASTAASPADSPAAAVDDAALDPVESNSSSNAKKEKKKKKKNAALAAEAAPSVTAAGAAGKSQGSPSASIDPDTLSPLSRVRSLKDSSSGAVGRKTPLPLVFPHMLPASPEVHVHRKPSSEDIAHAAKTRPVAAHSEAAIRLLTFGSQSHAKENHANGEEERKQRETMSNGKKGAHKNGHVAQSIPPPAPVSTKDDVSSASSSVASSAATTSTSSPVNTPQPQASPSVAVVEDDVWPVALNAGKKTKSAPAAVMAAAAVAAMDRTAATPPDPSPTVSPGASTRGSPRTVESYGAVAAGRNTAKVVRMHAALANLSNTAPRTVSAALQTSADKRNAAAQPKSAAAPAVVPAAVQVPVAAPIVKPTPTPIASPPRKHSAHQQPPPQQHQPPAPQPLPTSPQRVLPPSSPSRAQPHLVAPLAIAPIGNRTPENAQQMALQQTLLMVQQQQQRAQEVLRQQQQAYAQQRPMQQSFPQQQQQQHFVSFQPSRPFLNSSAPVDSYHVGSPSSSFDTRGHAAPPPSNLASVFHRGPLAAGSGAGSSSNSPPVSSRPHAFSDPEINFGQLHGTAQQPQQHHGAFELGNPARAYEHSSSYDHSLFHSPPSNQLHSTHPPHTQSQLRYDANSFGPSSSSQALPPSLFSFMHSGSAAAVSSSGHSAFSQQQPTSGLSMYSSSSLHSPQPMHPHPHPPAARAASASPVAPSSYLHHSFFGGLGLAQESLRRDLSYDDEESAEDLRMLATLNQPSTQLHSRRLVSYDSNSPLVSHQSSSALMFPHPLSPPTNSLLATPPLVPSFLMNPTQDDK